MEPGPSRALVYLDLTDADNIANNSPCQCQPALLGIGVIFGSYRMSDGHASGHRKLADANQLLTPMTFWHRSNMLFEQLA